MHPNKKPKLLIGITMGDPCGIGPEIIVRALASASLKRAANYLILGNQEVLDRTIKSLKIPLHYKTISDDSSIEDITSPLSLLSTEYFTPALIKKRGPTKEGGALSFLWIEKGIHLALQGKINALVTAPISKEAIHMAGHNYPGHTEILCDLSRVKRVVMLMVGGTLRVAFVTTHIALKEIPHSITVKNVLETITISNDYLKKYFNIKNPRIAVCGVNPHAGEEGIFGNEEEKIIAPAVKKARNLVITCDGPVSADTVFYKALKGTYDLVVSMYHDQGAIPLKLHAFEIGVNITLGIPFIRTSPDHGTAYDIAGKGIANPESMKEAIKMAIMMAQGGKKVLK
ncbi:MAG: 4-hydroxythreonine-4-phosphate dehydrogenase PdxA [Candidatus Kuenenia sp.]|nr:4-hydroxythreonine-4-phosphate dehydrogenase PdxA [Candidatus Kuenenia hertensis]